MPRLRVAAAQIDVVVGDLDGNVDRIATAIKQAEAEGADIVVTPELAVTGYPPEDLVLKPSFVDDNIEAVRAIASRTRSSTAFVGFVDHGDPPVMPDLRRALYNAVAVCHDGHIVSTYHKRLLPNYAVFDEDRYFMPGVEPLRPVVVRGVRVGATVCEDAWAWGGPFRSLGVAGAELIVNLNGSPFHQGKVDQREQVLRERVEEAGCPIVYVNLVGGQDELIFDGGSFVIDEAGSVMGRAAQFVEQLWVFDLDVPARQLPTDAPEPIEIGSGLPESASADALPPSSAPRLDPVHEVYEALVLGTRDYVTKNGFRDVVIGLSGGVDSSLVAAIAADALGAEHVHGVLMPSRYSSDGSITDAEALADA